MSQRILHVDDDADIREVVKLMLGKVGGYLVESAASGQEAIVSVQRQRFDLILLDVMMPGLDGPATLGHLKNEPNAAGVPIAFMTARALQSDQAELRQHGVAGIIDKPIRGRELLARVAVLLKGGEP